MSNRAEETRLLPSNQPLDIGVCLPKSIAMTEPLESHKSGSLHNIPRTNPTPNSSGIPHVATKIREEPIFPVVSDRPEFVGIVVFYRAKRQSTRFYETSSAANLS